MRHIKSKTMHVVQACVQWPTLKRVMIIQLHNLLLMSALVVAVSANRSIEHEVIDSYEAPNHAHHLHYFSLSWTCSICCASASSFSVLLCGIPLTPAPTNSVKATSSPKTIAISSKDLPLVSLHGKGCQLAVVSSRHNFTYGKKTKKDAAAMASQTTKTA